MEAKEHIRNLKTEIESYKADVTRLNKERVILEEQLGIKEIVWRRAYGKKLKTKAKVIFWEVIFKPALGGLLWGIRRWIDYNKTDVKEPYNCVVIPQVLERSFPKGDTSFAVLRIRWGGEVLAHFLSLDYSYQVIWEKFIKDYYSIIYENKLLTELKYIDENEKNKV